MRAETGKQESSEAFKVVAAVVAPSNSTALTAARTLLVHFDGNEERTVEALVAQATRSRDLRDSLLDLGARSVLRMLLSEERRAIIRSVNRQTPNHDAANARLQGHINRMYDYPILNRRMKLGDARYDDLMEQAREHERNETSNARFKQLFQMLARKLEGQRQLPVRKVLSEDDIKAAFRKAKVNL